MTTSNETERFNWDIPAWNADWQKWQEKFGDLIRNIESTVFANMTSMQLIMKQLPTVEVVDLGGGDWRMIMSANAVFVSRTLLTDIVVAQESVSLTAGGVIGLTLAPGAVGQQAIGWEVFDSGLDNSPDVVPIGYIDSSYNIIWYNGSILAPNTPTILFGGGSGSGGGGVRKAAVIDYVDCTAAPPTESTGDRYILDDTVGTVHANWDGAAKLDIVEFGTVSWAAETPEEGWVTYVDALNMDALYVDDGAPAWEFRAPATAWPADSVVFVERGDTDVESGTALLAAWTAAKALTPGGNALSATNRAMLIIPPGRYDLGSGTLTLDSEYVDVMGYGICRRIEWAENGAITYPTTCIVSSGSTVVNITQGNNTIRGFKVEQSNAANDGVTVAHGDLGLISDIGVSGPVDSSGGECFSQGVSTLNVSMDQCHAAGLFGTFFPLTTGTLTGNYTWCTAGYKSFRSSISGRFENCFARDYSFSSTENVGGSTTCSGTFIDCTAFGNYCFGAVDDASADTCIVSGTFKRCTGEDRCFGAASSGSGLMTVSGTFEDCHAVEQSFARHGLFSGIARNCSSGILSFGVVQFNGKAYGCQASGSSFGGSTVLNTGQLYDCRLIDRPSILRWGGYMRNCLLEKNSGTAGFIEVDDSSGAPKFYGCTIISNGSEAPIFPLTASENIRMAHCRLNNNVDAGITNLIGSGYNVVDSDVVEP